MSILEQLTPEEIDRLARDVGEAIHDTRTAALRKVPTIKLDDMLTDGALTEALDAFTFNAKDGPYNAETLKRALAAAIVAAWTHEEDG